MEKTAIKITYVAKKTGGGLIFFLHRLLVFFETSTAKKIEPKMQIKKGVKEGKLILWVELKRVMFMWFGHDDDDEFLLSYILIFDL